MKKYKIITSWNGFKVKKRYLLFFWVPTVYYKDTDKEAEFKTIEKCYKVYEHLKNIGMTVEKL